MLGRDTGGDAAPKGQLDDVLGALNHPIRRGILRILALGPTHVKAIAEALRVAENAVSYHLEPLLVAGLVSYEKLKKASVYRLAPGVTVEVQGKVLHVARTIAEGAKIDLHYPLKEALEAGPRKLHGRIRRIGF